MCCPMPDPWTAGDPPTGHRVLPHTADLIIEAWAPTRPRCLEEAVRALVQTFADTGDATPTAKVPFSSKATTPEEQLVAVLEEVIYLVDVRGEVPADVQVDSDLAEGRVSGRFGVVPAEEAEPVGSVPKAVSLHELEMTHEPAGDGERWRCRAIVDV